MAQADYYALLDVHITSTPSEIKVAYRKQALLYHPDRHSATPATLDAATARFKMIQEAYEVLSDERERSWYDAHREEIISGGRGAGEGNVKPASAGLTASDLMAYFQLSCYSGLKGAKGFFSVYGRLFEKIEEEEIAARAQRRAYKPARHDSDSEQSDYDDRDSGVPERTSFGNADSAYPAAFYAKFLSFSTAKPFTWKEKWRTSDAPDRRIRRLMERENSKLRSKEKLAYVDAVRSLAAYVRKRDPRYKVFAEEQERERLRKMAEEKERIRKEKQERAERAKQWKPQAWEVIDRESKELSHDEAASGSSEENGTDGDEDEDDFFEDGEGFEDYVKEDGEAEESDGEGEPEIDEELLAESEEDDLVPDDLYCAACEKRFANPASYTNHEGSKKHRENVERIKKEIDREEKLLAKQNRGKPKPIVAPKAGFDTVRDNVEDEDSEDDVPVPRRRRSGAPSPPTPFPQAHTPPDMDLDTAEPAGGIEDGFEDDETFNQPKQKSKKKAGRRKARTDYAGLMGSDSDEPAVEPPTIDSLKIEDSDSEPVKATPGKPKKARRRKDKAAATSGSPAPETSEADSAPASTPAVDQGAAEATLCLVCGVVFPSRTKLFAHVKSTGHAVPATVAAAVAAARQAEMEEGTRKGKKGKRR